MKYGVVFPQIEFGNDVQAIKDYAQTAEGLGYDYLLVYDHVLGAHPSREPKLTGPYTYEHPFHEPMVLFGFLAAVSARLELVTGILILPQRQTALVAKQTAEVDVLSGGRRVVSDARAARRGADRAPPQALDQAARHPQGRAPFGRQCGDQPAARSTPHPGLVRGRRGARAQARGADRRRLDAGGQAT